MKYEPSHAQALEEATKLRLERRDMLAAWLLARQREGVQVVRFDDPHLAALMKLCTESEEQVLKAIGATVSRLRNGDGERE